MPFYKQEFKLGILKHAILKTATGLFSILARGRGLSGNQPRAILPGCLRGSASAVPSPGSQEPWTLRTRAAGRARQGRARHGRAGQAPRAGAAGQGPAGQGRGIQTKTHQTHTHTRATGYLNTDIVILQRSPSTATEWLHTNTMQISWHKANTSDKASRNASFTSATLKLATAASLSDLYGFRMEKGNSIATSRRRLPSSCPISCPIPPRQ